MSTSSQRNNEQRVLIAGLAFVLLIIGFSVFRSQQKFEAVQKSDDTVDTEDTSNINTISPQELQARLSELSADKKTLVLDLRSAEDFAVEHIIDSKNVTSDTLARFIPPTSEQSEGFLIVIVNRIVADAGTRQIVKNLMDNGVKASLLQGGFDAWTATLGPTISIGNPKSPFDANKVHVISAEQAKEALDKSGPFVTFVDTRSSEAFAAGHIPGAVNVPLASLETRRRDIPRRPNTIVYNDDVLGSFQSAVRLFDLNFFDARVIEDGWDAWKNKGYPVEK